MNLFSFVSKLEKPFFLKKNLKDFCKEREIWKLQTITNAWREERKIICSRDITNATIKIRTPTLRVIKAVGRWILWAGKESRMQIFISLFCKEIRYIINLFMSAEREIKNSTTKASFACAESSYDERLCI